MNLEMAALKMLAAEREISLDTVVHALEEALLTAYRQHVGQGGQSGHSGQPGHDGEEPAARVTINRKTGAVSVLVRETDEAGVDLGEVDATPEDFGRVAAATARTVVRQRLRDAETDSTVGTWSGREGDVVVGTIQQGPGRSVHVDLGDVEAEIGPNEQVPGERYLHGHVIRAYVLGVTKGLKGPQVALSRTHPRLVAGLFSREVPEVANGQIEVVAIAREAGHRSKVAVRTSVQGLSAKGACVGPDASRVRAVVSELNGEKIDIALWSEDPAVLLTEALSPARVLRVEVLDAASKIARVTVPDYQLSLAIGREGQNARLAARLTGWKIDIRSDAEADPAAAETGPPAAISSPAHHHEASPR